MTSYTLRSITLFFTLFCLVSSAYGGDYSKPQELIDQGQVVIKKFGASKDTESFRNTVKHARAIIVFPKVLKGGLVIGGSGGSGVLLSRDPVSDNWSYPVFYTMGSMSIGLQIGAEAAEMVLLVMTDRGMDSLLTSSFKLGVDASAAMGPTGAGAKAATADILAYTISQGLYGGASIEGAIIKTRDGWNRSYYQQDVSPADIIIRNKFANQTADQLRTTMAEVAGGKAEPRQ